MKRNLHYFVYPLQGSIWDWNVAQLKPYLSSFNGKKVVGVAVDERTEPLDVVAKAFGDPGIDFVAAQNDPWRRESVTFLQIMDRLRSQDPDEITFYGHAKGICPTGGTTRRIQAWNEAMYVLNLSRIDIIEWLMKRYSAVGAFRHIMPHFGSSWHYSGTFFWVKHEAIFSKNWTEIEGSRWGVEAYVGRHIPLEESFDLTLCRYFGNLYDMEMPLSEVPKLIMELETGMRSGEIRQETGKQC